MMSIAATESRFFLRVRFVSFVVMVACCSGGYMMAQVKTATEKRATEEVEKVDESHFGWPLVLDENFSAGSSQWQPTDPSGWKLFDVEGGKAFGLSNKSSKYKPEHRSPENIAILSNVVVSDCVLEAKVQSTVKEYPHRDVVLVFGYQNPQRFYYTHFASRMDPHANQIFIVNDAERVKISEISSDGVKWTDDWHRLKIVRKIDDGLIEAYFDDMTTPIMTAHDKTFAWGQIGIGSFDDTARYSEIKLWGNVVKPAEP
ncbi:MAG: hypothetical protein IT427_13380 [Pirellulales bacterium]|nr:hypothetical protein [Pirellulales bacterium]